MTQFGDELIQSLNEALAFVNGEGPARVHTVVLPKMVRKKINLTQAEMAPLVGMSLSGYRKIEQGNRSVSGPLAVLLRVIDADPSAVRKALAAK